MGIDTGTTHRRFVTTTVEVEGRDETKVVELPEHEPTPWGPDAELTVVGQRAVRVDAAEKVAGRARYTTEIPRVGLLHAAILRSTIARGRVVLDVSPARAVDGVVDVITAADLETRIRMTSGALFDTTISYAGQPLAAVCAETLDAARRGVEAIVARYESEPHLGSFEAAVAPGAPAARRSSRPAPSDPTRSANLVAGSPDVVERGDIARGLAEADVIVRREYRTPVQLHTALEPHGAVAEWEGDRLTVWESTQAVFRVREQVAKALGVTHSSVRVIKEHMGGGFGSKTSAGPYTFAAALLARRTGRPVRCINDREGEQTDSGNRPSTRQRVTLGARRDGRLTAIGCESDVPLGIGGWEGGPAALFHEMYSCPNVRTVERFAYVNTAAMTAFRAPGHVEGAFALESAMDALARELGIDPLEFRRINFAERDEKKDRPFSSNRLRECYDRGAELFDWNAPRKAQGRWRRGKGMAAQIWGAGGGPPAYAIVKINRDGSADVLTGTQDLGTGSRTILAQIAAEALGARLADVRIVLGDTERTPYTGPSWGSMTTASVGPAVRVAAEDALRQLIEAASEVLDVPASQLSAVDGTISSDDGGGGALITFRALCDRLGDVMILGRGARGPNASGVGLASFGAQFAEVEVDADTGVVRVVRIVAVHDAGRIINPTLAESQVEGGIIQGLGYGLFEERVLDGASGRPLNANIHDYKIPTMGDVPRIEVELLDVADAVANHTGARGLAEPPIIPTAPAIANAVADAIGVEVLELPLTPWRVLAAIREAGSAR